MINEFDLKKVSYLLETKNNYFLESGFKNRPKRLLTKDNSPKINWKVLPQFKTILGYKCQNAIGTFRGREYSVWFTSEIPLQAGPWKLNGLPGLILEAEDSQNLYKYVVKQINLETNQKFPNEILSYLSKNLDKMVPHKDYINNENMFLKELISLSLASLPEGSQLFEKKILRDKEKEILFEWETEPVKP